MSEIPEDLKQRTRWEIEKFDRPHADTSKALLERVEELEAHILSLTDRLDEKTIFDSINEIQEWHERKPEVSLERRDRLKQAEVLGLAERYAKCSEDAAMLRINAADIKAQLAT